MKSNAMRKITTILLALLMVVTFIPGMAFAADGDAEAKEVTISVVAQKDKNVYCYANESLKVKSDEAEKAGLYEPEGYANKDIVTVLDAVVAVHRDFYGAETFDSVPGDYLSIRNTGMIDKYFGTKTMDLMLWVNDKYPTYADDPNTGSWAYDTPLEDGDLLRVFPMLDMMALDRYIMLDAPEKSAFEDDDIDFEVTSFFPSYLTDAKTVPEEGATVVVKKGNDVIASAVSDAEGKVSLKVAEPGTYAVTVSEVAEIDPYELDMPSDTFAAPYCKLTVKPVVSAKVTLSAGTAEQFDMIEEEITATSDLSETYFPVIEANEPTGVSFADVLVAAHIKKYGEDKVKDYLDISSGNWGTQMNKQFGHDFVGVYYDNNAPLTIGVSEEVNDGDNLFAMAYVDDTYAGSKARFDKDSISTVTEKTNTLSVIADDAFSEEKSPDTATIYVVNSETGEITEEMESTYANGKVKFSFDKPGSYLITVKGTVPFYGKDCALAGALAKVTVKDAESAKEEAEKAVADAEKAIEDAQAALDAANAEMAAATTDEEKAAAQAKIDQAQADLSAAQQTLDNAKKDLEEAERDAEFAAVKKEAQKAKEEAEAAKTELEQVKKDLEKAKKEAKKASIKDKVPAQVGGLKLKKGKKKFTATWKAVAGAKYELQYRIKGSWNTVDSKSAKKVVKKLKKGKKYQVRVRAYKVVDSVTLYGKWSKVAKVKVK